MSKRIALQVPWLVAARNSTWNPPNLRNSQRSLHGTASDESSSLKTSYVAGPLHPPLVHSTLSAFFNDTVLQQHAERPALICRSEKPRAHGGPNSPNLSVESHLAWSFGELDTQVKTLARGLIALGVKKGDRVGVIMGNNRCDLFEL
jgi:non-ribosomal peptide synthetase component F